jgi:hypothetical protein
MDYLKELSEDHELMLVSFFVTNPEAKNKLKEQWSKRDILHREYKGRSEKQTKALSSETFGGSVCLIDPSNLEKGILAEVKTPIATGMLYDSDGERLYVSRNKWINVVREGRIVDQIGFNLFNDLHSISKSIEGNLLIVSTGIDGILEFSLDDFSKPIWEWLATEKGYKITPKGEIRTIRRNLNYQLISTTTPQHTTHINSALNYERNKVLATLFHQGQLIEIDKLTGESKIIDSGMKGPHSIRTRRDGFLVSDTINNQVRLYNHNYEIEDFIKGDYNWIIDTIETKSGCYLIADSNNDRIVMVNHKGEGIEKLEKGLEDKIMYTFHPITPGQALKVFGKDSVVMYR